MIEAGSREWIRATLALSLGSSLLFLNLYQTHPLLPLLAQIFSVNSLAASWALAGWFSDWQLTFLGIGVISLSLLPLVFWLLPKQARFVSVNPASGQFALALRGNLTNPLLMWAYLIGGLNFMVFLNQFSHLTFLLAKPPFSLPTRWLGMLFLNYLSYRAL